MSFLNELKSQARNLQDQRGQQSQELDRHLADTEGGCRVVLHYLDDLARQLNVISPAAPKLSLDGKTPWPPMKLSSFRVDARKKKLRDREVFDYVAMGWQILPLSGEAVAGTVSVNFPPDLERVESRLSLGMVKHERAEVRHPEKSTLLAIRFDYLTESRGNITITPDHAQGTLEFRLVNASGFGLVKSSWPAVKVKTDVLDELAKLVVSQPNRFA